MASANTKDIKDMKSASARGCPFHTQKAAALAMDWWPNQLNLKSLGKVPPAEPKPYIEEMKSLDIKELKDDIVAVMTTSVDWWPADYGHYGPFFIRMAWHSAGTYRTLDGRGGGGHGMLRFAPLNSWPDNGNLDKARRLLWPLKRKYGRKVSWADLMLYTGHCALEHMGLKTFGFAFGREDLWEPEDDIYWGQETEWLAAERGGAGAELDKPLSAVQMGLIYVNPEGPGGNPDPLQSAHDIRETFGRMAMNDEETVALIAGGHTFGKGHGAADPSKHVGPEPEGASIEEQGLGWKNSFGTGKGADTITSGLEGAWTANPAKWDHGYFENLMKYEWTQSKSPAGATLWIPTDKDAATLVPDAHVPDKKHPPVMFTTDLALKMDPQYAGISKRFHENPEEFADAFAKAWYKLTHRDMGPHARLVGPLVPPAQIWQDPIPPPSGAPLGASEIAELKSELLKEANGLSISELVKTAWAAAASYRGTDHRGGANGARVRLEPQKQWAANDPPALATALEKLEKVRSAFNAKGGAQASLADVIVLGGCAAIESAAKSGGNEVVVPFSPGRTDATQEQTDAASFAVLEPTADGFRNYLGAADKRSPQSMGASPEALLVDKAHMLNLTKAEMTVLVAGLRVLGANTGGATEGVLTATPGVLTNDFFVNLLDMSVVWSKKDGGDEVYEGKSRSDGTAKWTASRVDLIFGSNSQLRALAEHYACDDAKATFVADFVAAWSKVMDLDRYDLKK